MRASEKSACLALAAGACAALSSVCGKHALDAAAPPEDAVLRSAIPRPVALVVLVFLNAKMWTLFTHALALSETSLLPTAINTAANFIISVWRCREREGEERLRGLEDWGWR